LGAGAAFLASAFFTSTLAGAALGAEAPFFTVTVAATGSAFFFAGAGAAFTTGNGFLAFTGSFATALAGVAFFATGAGTGFAAFLGAGAVFTVALGAALAAGLAFAGVLVTGAGFATAFLGAADFAVVVFNGFFVLSGVATFFAGAAAFFTGALFAAGFDAVDFLVGTALAVATFFFAGATLVGVAVLPFTFVFAFVACTFFVAMTVKLLFVC
jgi:hypothetical protein